MKIIIDEIGYKVQDEVANLLNVVSTERDDAVESLETTRMQLAACGVAALANTNDTVKQRIGKDNEYWTASYGDVCRAVDMEIRYREALDKIIHELGVPGPGYPQPVVNAYNIANDAINCPEL